MYLITLNWSLGIIQLNNEGVSPHFVKDHLTYIPDNSEIIQDFSLVLLEKEGH